MFPLCHVMICWNESPGYDVILQTPPSTGHKASVWPALHGAFIKPVSSQELCACSYVCVYAHARLQPSPSRHWGALSGIHSGAVDFILPICFIPLPTRFTVAGERDLLFTLLFSFSNPPEPDRPWSRAADRWCTMPNILLS